jgi:hypothetical protein
VTVAGPDVVEEYLSGLSARLIGPGRAKRGLLAEARDGLVDATEAYLEAGLPPAEAARLAVADFGGYRQVVPSYQTELAVSQGRRTALLVAVTMPAVLVASRLMWTRTPDVLLSHAFGVLQVTAAIMAVLTLVGYGWGSRYLPADRIPAAVVLTRLTGVGVLTFVLVELLTGGVTYGFGTHPAWFLLPLALLVAGRSAVSCLRVSGVRGAGLR